MASTYSTNLKIELIASGSQAGTWGNTTNTNLGTAIEEAITGRAAVSFSSDANLTLTAVDLNTTQLFRNLLLDVTSVVSLTAARDLIVPTITKQYVVWNNTTGGQAITVRTTAGTGVSVPNGARAHLFVDGTDVEHAITSVNGTAVPADDTLVTLAEFNTALSDGSFASLDGAETLTNKTIDLDDNTLTGTLAQFSTAVSDATLARTDAAQTFTGRQTFSGTDGLVIPVGTTAQRDGSPVIGLARLNTSLGIMEYYDGTVWRGFGEQFVEIGTPMGGGYFAGYISTSADGVPTHYLIVAPKATGESPTTLAYGPTGRSDPTSFIDGPANTATLVATGNAPAAQFCAAVTAGGFTDWYLPARYELDVLYFSLKPTTANNRDDGDNNTGINPNAVPERSAFFTAVGPPRQTKAAQFREGNSEAFEAGFYWSSSQSGTSIAWRQVFDNGLVSSDGKTFLTRVRAVRRIAI